MAARAKPVARLQHVTMAAPLEIPMRIWCCSRRERAGAMEMMGKPWVARLNTRGTEDETEESTLSFIRSIQSWS